MRIIITGANGQLGKAIQNVLTEQGLDIIPIDLPEYDIAEHNIVQYITNTSPDVVIHCAALTNVDGCASNPDEAFRINAFGTQNVAHGCMRCNADLVYISTNEVFDGQTEEPYQEDSPTNPINPYASSKRSGEKMAMRYQPQTYVVRTAWLYGPGGNNFPTKIIAAADKYKKLQVVTDEIGNPTYAPDLAEAVAKLIKTRAYGIYHFVNEGYCSRYELAQKILELSGRADIPIEPITLADYQRASTVPPFTPLLNLKGTEMGIELPPWSKSLTNYITTYLQ